MNTKLTAWLGAAALTALAGMAQAASADKTLDRAGLIKLADDYFVALVAHDPGKASLASDVKTVENAKRIKAGEGLWKTTSAGPTEFKIVVPDTMSQQVGGMAMIQSDGKPAQVGFRLKVVNGKIVEAEHMIAVPREQSLANLHKPRPGILILPAASTTECRVWVQFPQPRRVDQEEMIAADLFAQAFGLAVDRVIAAQRADDGKADLQRAVESHERIGQAVGIHVERYRISPAAAFDRLREASQNRNLKLREIAARVTRTGADPEQA